MYANDREFREEMQRFDQVLQQEDLDMANIDQQLERLFDPADFEVSTYLNKHVKISEHFCLLFIGS